MRKCSWLSLSEFEQLVPEKIVRGIGAGLKGPFVYQSTAQYAGRILKRNADYLNLMMRKFGIVTPRRMAAFVGNSIQETKWWSALAEENGDQLRYAPWFGRGFLQLTNSSGKFEPDSNYARYFAFRGAVLPEFTETELHVLRCEIKESPYEACASAGVYWSWMAANKIADGYSENKRIAVMAHLSNIKGELKEVAIYANAAFRRVACAINLPSSIAMENPHLVGWRH